MEFSKLKLKSSEVQLFNIDEQIQPLIEDSFKEVAMSDIVLISIIKIEQLPAINDFIASLDLDTDLVIWIMYPKGTSKRYKSIVSVNRDLIRTQIYSGVRTVSMVSLDSDWSAMRLRSKVYSK